MTGEYIGKWISVIVMLLCCGWFFARWKDPGFPWEPLVPFVLAVGAYLKLELRQLKQSREERTPSQENDAELFRALHDLLPSHEAIAFVRQHDFGGSFRLDDLDPIGRFCYEWDNPQHQFNDPKLELQRSNLLRAAKYFSQAIAKNTAPRAPGLQSAIPTHIDSDGPFPEWVKRDIREIHQAADALINEHEKMMKLGRRLMPMGRQS